MKLSRIKQITAAALFLTAAVTATAAGASADTPGHHPAYIHGLRDLRVAHRLLDHEQNSNVDWREVHALRDIDAAYRYAVGAGERDRKDLHTYEPIDANLRHRDRIVRAISALEAAHRDFSQYESDGAALGWRHDAVVYVDRAIIEARHALRDQRWDRGY